MLSDRIRPSFQFFAVKPVLASLLLIFQAAPHPEASPQHLRFRRQINQTPPSGQAGTQTCAVLDAAVFTHASPSLKDLRIYAGETSQTGAGETNQTEIPYAITLSEPAQQDTDEGRILNLGTRSGHIVFDLEMPNRPYTAVALDLAAHDFIATAEVSGSQTLATSYSTRLGTFTLFDLTSQHLSHSTTLPLAESSFPYLHVDLSLVPAPGTSAPATTLNRADAVKGASVPPSREAQTLYTTIQQTSTLIQRGRETVATFLIPSRVPIERIAVTLAPTYKGSFSRAVRIDAHVTSNKSTASENSDPANAADAITEDDSPPSTETTTGTILSVHKLEAGREIAYESLSLPTAIGSNMQHPATLEVAIENGDDAPLPVASIQARMRQRRICFDAGALRPFLYYGDPTLEAPVYDYAKLFQTAANPVAAALEPESLNAAFTPRTDDRPFTERHPELLWIVLLAVVCVLALTAFRSAKKLPQ